MDDDFVPEGRVPLISAIEQLAEARQTGVPSARDEIRTKLYGRSIAAQAMERKSGRMFHVISDSWATEATLNWLESGTCLLPDEKGKVRITTERFAMLYGPEIATILILESDLQRLIGRASKREAKRPVTSDAEAKRLFEEYRTRRGDDIPSLKEDVNYMRQFGVSRARVRNLRKGDGVVNRSRGRTVPNRRSK